MPRLFVAAVPDRAAVDALRSLPRPEEPGVRWVPESNWHVTLRFLGDVELAETTSSLRDIDATRCRAVLGPTVEWLGDRQIVVPIDGVADLASAVVRATGNVGRPDPRPFVGHLTIARTKPGATSSLLGAPVDAAFDVDRLAVMESDLRPDGAVYTVVATIPIDTTTRRA